MLSYEQQQYVERMAPERYEAPSGSRLQIDYSPEDPAVSARLQARHRHGAPRSLPPHVCLTTPLPAARPGAVRRDQDPLDLRGPGPADDPAPVTEAGAGADHP